MICTDCIGSHKSNYHTITPKAAFSLSLLPIFFTTWFIQKNVIILACIRCISIKIVVLPHHVFSLTHFLNLVIVALMVHYSVDLRPILTKLHKYSSWLKYSKFGNYEILYKNTINSRVWYIDINSVVS